MPALTWIALAFFLVATIGTGVHAGLRGWRTLKTFGSVAGSLGRALDRVFQGADDASRAAAALPERTEELEHELTALAESRAQLGVLLGALGRARTTLDGFRGVVYGK